MQINFQFQLNFYLCYPEYRIVVNFISNLKRRFYNLACFIQYLLNRKHIIISYFMSKTQTDTHLKFGQGILVQGYKSEGDDIGFLAAKGFADSQAKYQTYGNILYFKNYRNAIFQIIPAGNFQINDQLRKILQNSNEQTPNVKILKARAQSQEVQFQLNIQNKQKELVCFGYRVIFKHIDSETYLSGTIRPSAGSNGAFSVEVTKNYSESLIFQLLPFRSFQKLGMPIPFDSPILIRNIFNNGYLTFQKIGVGNLKGGKRFDLDKKPIQADQSYRIPVKTNSSQSSIYDTVTHFVDLSVDKKQVPMPWQFVLHVNQTQNDCLIQHDIVYFQHTENGGVLSTVGTDIVLKELKGEAASELRFYQCLWEIQTHDKAQNAYILRHLMSGMTLGVQKTKQDGEEVAKRPILVDISQGQSDNALEYGYVQLKLAKKQGGQINSDSFINISWGEACLDIRKQILTRQYEMEEQESYQLFPKAKLAQMVLNEQEYEIKKLEFTLDISKHCFVIQEIADQLKKEVLFALSFHSKIIDLRQDLKWGPQEAAKKVTYLRMMQVTQKIKQIKDFLKNCRREQSDLDYFRPIQKRQMICKDLGISELLFQLLFYMKENLKQTKSQDKKISPIFATKHNQREKFIELYNTLYEVITELIRDNKMFKIHISKWIMFILDDVIEKNEPSQLALMKQLLTNNDFIVGNFISDKLVQFLAKSMIDRECIYIFHEKKYIQIFRLLCICGQTVNTQNQIKVLNYFIKQLRSNPRGPLYQINLSKKDQVVFTQAAIDKNIAKKRKFGDYYKICKEEYESAWWYFVQYLNLIADMTKGRNKTVQSYIETMMTLDVLSQLFESHELYEAQVPIIRLLHYLYAQSQRFYPIQRKKRIVDYQLLAVEQIKVMSTSSQVKPWDPPINRVLKNLQKKLKQFGPIDPSQIGKNQNLFHILDFVWQTLNLGFWESKQQVKNILEDILVILKPHPSINYETAKIQSKQNLLMIKCKNQCMNIIQVILDYDVDLTVRYISKHFQQFKLPKRQKKSIQVQKLMDEKIQNALAQNFIETFPKQSEPLVQTGIISQMIELSNYNNPSLTSQSISIIQRILLAKSKAIETFYEQIFICGEERKKLINYIEERKSKFFTLEDQTLVNVSMANQAGNYVIVYRDDKDSGIMQDIWMISQLVRFQNSVTNIRPVATLDSSKAFRQLGTNKLINFTSQRTSSDIMKQQALDAENIHWKVMQFIVNCKQIPTQELAIKLLHLCYKFLVGLIWNYQQIKPYLIPYVNQLSHHIIKNVGCIDFLKQMYDNNKNMLFNQAEIIKLIKQICHVIENQPDNSFYKAKLLDFFRFLIYCNGKSLKSNQIQILKTMQDDSYTKLIQNVTVKDIKQLILRYVEDNKQIQGEKFKTVVKMQPKLVYLCTYFQIMESLIDDNNKVNMGKLLKKFPFDFLVECIKQSKTCWPLKRNIRAFLNRLYYFQPQIQTYMKTIINQEVGNIIQDLNYYIEIKCKSNVQEYEAQIFENPVRFTYLQSYLYLNLEQNLFTLYELTTRPKIQEQMKNFLHSLNNANNDGPYNFIRMCERLGFIKNYFADKKNIYTNSFIKFLLSKFRTIISEFDDSIYLPGMNSFSGLNRAPTKPQKQKARVYLIQKIMQGQISTFYVQGTGQYDKVLPLVYQVPDKVLGSRQDKKPNQAKLIKKLREMLKRQKKQFKTLDDQIAYKLRRLVTAIKLSSDSRVMLLNDYNSKLSPYSSHQSIFSYITIIIDMNTQNPEALPQNQKKFFLQLITGIVQQNNKTLMNCIKPIDEWEAQDWQDYKDKIQKIQIKLKSCGLGKFITELLKQNICDSIQFANAILLCGISYMLGGNTLTQKNIIQEMDSDNQNKVMLNIDTLISKLGKFILKNIDEGNLQQQNQNTFSTTTIDNYDFYDYNKKYVLRKNVFEPITTDEEIYYQKSVITYRRAFKFLQLLCENNNIQGKNFIREQKKTRQANFINITTKQLRNLFQVINKEISDVPMFLLDFLLQVTQIPVKSNQQALMSLTFFQDLCQMQNFFSKEGNIQKRGFQYQPQLLDAIYFKSIQIILSNFQGNDRKTFQAVDSKLQPKFLINILRRKLTQMEIKTKEDLQKYIQKQNLIFGDDMTSILNIIIIFMKLKNTLGEQNSRVFASYLKEKAQNQKLYELLESSLINIEINDQYNKLQTVLFPKYPVFNSLSGNLRDYIMASVQRSTHRDKIVSLLGFTGGIKQKIQSSYTLQKQQSISEKNMKDSFNISAIMSIVLCVYMMNFYDVIIQYGQAEFTSGRLIGLGRFVLSLIQLSMSCVFAFYWYKLRIWEKPQRKSRQAQQSSSLVEQTQQKDGSGSPSRFQFIYNKINEGKEWLGLTGGDQDATKIYKSAEFYRLALYVGVSFFGTFFHPPLFFIHIIDIFCNNPQLGDIFAAIAYSIQSILYVSFLGVVFVFIFCTVTFSNYMKDVYAEGQSQSEMCQTMFDCLMQLFVSGAIGQTMATFQIFRFVYDMIYITFFGMLFGNIISGIMLDAFASLREQNDNLVADKKNQCYICNITRQDLQKSGISFADHTLKKHFLWNYVFYIYALEKKSSTNYTGLEYYISTRYNRPDEQVDVGWVPSADTAEFDSAQKLKQILGQVQQQNKKISDNMQQIDNKISQFNEIAQEYLA